MGALPLRLTPIEAEAERSRGAVPLDARPREAWLSERIAGARSLPSLYDEIVEDTRSEALPALSQRWLSRLAQGSTVSDGGLLVYDEDDGMRAARGVWLARWLGFRAQLIAGGMAAWREAGLPTDSGASLERTRRTTRQGRDDSLLAAIDALDGFDALLDVRSPEEYAGETTSACCQRPGRMPDAVHLDWRLIDDRAALRARLAELGLEPGARVACYCHRGARSAAVTLALRELGYQAANILGSWHEWCQRHPA